MSSKITNLKEKFKIALTSTAKVISDDFDLNKKTYEDKKIKEFNTIEIEDLTNPSDFIRLRAETDSAALKKKFSNDEIYKKNLPTNNSSRSLYNIAEWGALHATNSVSAAKQELSFFEDVDFAAETSELAKHQIIAQAGTAMLAQANAQAQGILALIQP